MSEKEYGNNDRLKAAFDATIRKEETVPGESLKTLISGPLGIEDSESEVDGSAEGIDRLDTIDGSVVFDREQVARTTTVMQEEFVEDFEAGLFSGESVDNKFPSERFGYFFEEETPETLETVHKVLVQMKDEEKTIDEISFNELNLDDDGKLVKDIIDSLRNFAKRDEIKTALNGMLPNIPVKVKNENGQPLQPQAMVTNIDGEATILISGGSESIEGFEVPQENNDYKITDFEKDDATGTITITLGDSADGSSPKFKKVTFFVKQKFDLEEQMKSYEERKLKDLMDSMSSSSPSQSPSSYRSTSPRAASTTPRWQQPTSYVSSG